MIKLKKIIKKYSIPVLILLIGLFVFLSSSRQENLKNSTPIDQEVYAYLSVPVPLLDYWINFIKTNNIQTYGMMFFKGFVNIINAVLLRFKYSFPGFEYANEIEGLTEIFFPIFEGHVYNAFVTLFFAFYVDFREIGVFIGCLVYGLIFSSMYTRAVYTKKDILSISILLLMYQGLIKCFVRWEFVQISYCLSFFWIFIFVKKKEVLVNEQKLRAKSQKEFYL